MQSMLGERLRFVLPVASLGMLLLGGCTVQTGDTMPTPQLEATDTTPADYTPRIIGLANRIIQLYDSAPEDERDSNPTQNILSVKPATDRGDYTLVVSAAFSNATHDPESVSNIGILLLDRDEEPANSLSIMRSPTDDKTWDVICATTDPFQQDDSSQPNSSYEGRQRFTDRNDKGMPRYDPPAADRLLNNAMDATSGVLDDTAVNRPVRPLGTLCFAKE